VISDDELVKIAKVLATADGGCPSCVPAIFRVFVESFPEHSARMKELYHLVYDDEYNFWEDD
jgi:hypothetical protein